MVHVGPAPTPPPLPHSTPSTRPHPPPLPVLPPPPPRIDTREPRLSGALLGGLGVTAGVILALLVVKFANTPETTTTPGPSDETQLSLQRELVREIAALRAARSEPTPAVADQRLPPPTEAAKPKTTRIDRPARPKERPEPAKRARADRAAATEPRAIDETRADLQPVSAAASGDDLFQGIR